MIDKNPPPLGISSEEAKELAMKYVGSGVSWENQF